MVTKSIKAVELDGGREYEKIMVFSVDELVCVDLMEAVQAACDEYVTTEEGDMVYQRNAQTFDWMDFWENVPNDLCKKYGFVKIDDVVPDFTDHMGRQLVGETGVCQFPLEQWRELKHALMKPGENRRQMINGFLSPIGKRFGTKDVIDTMRMDKALDSARFQLTKEHCREWYEKMCKAGIKA